MTQRLYFLGRTPELSIAELSSFGLSVIPITPDIVQIESIPLSDEESIDVLGGVVKIAEVLERTNTLDPTHLISHLKQSKSKVAFAISGYGIDKKTIMALDQDIKDLFTSSHIASRFLLPHDGSVVSSVALVKEHIEELVIVKEKSGYIIGKTTAIQPFEKWNDRDYGRPFADAKAGMLPPKIARMIVNMGLGIDSVGKTLLDPFCGMGTICAEAALRGVNAIGSDIDSTSVEKAKKNMSWILSRYKLASSIRIFQADATHIDEYIDSNSIDTIVTEPLLGPTKLGAEHIHDVREIQNIMKGLEKLYIGCFRSWTNILKYNGVVVIAFPSFEVGKTVYSVKKVVDTCETLGYTKLLGPIIYGRPQAVVRRNFYLFKYGTR
ncbi:MAG: methlyase protein [Microgenomates group bacterium GW2011_GWC1_39_12]|nr:MAG: methlyase protein [Microgenomates group bacterium GW2011_GWC1_39_12]